MNIETLFKELTHRMFELDKKLKYKTYFINASGNVPGGFNFYIYDKGQPELGPLYTIKGTGLHETVRRSLGLCEALLLEEHDMSITDAMMALPRLRKLGFNLEIGVVDEVLSISAKSVHDSRFSYIRSVANNKQFDQIIISMVRKCYNFYRKNRYLWGDI